MSRCRCRQRLARQHGGDTRSSICVRCARERALLGRFGRSCNHVVPAYEVEGLVGLHGPWWFESTRAHAKCVQKSPFVLATRRARWVPQENAEPGPASVLYGACEGCGE